jgi:hypothetical protein
MKGRMIDLTSLNSSRTALNTAETLSWKPSSPSRDRADLRPKAFGNDVEVAFDFLGCLAIQTRECRSSVGYPT